MKIACDNGGRGKSRERRRFDYSVSNLPFPRVLFLRQSWISFERSPPVDLRNSSASDASRGNICEFSGQHKAELLPFYNGTALPLRMSHMDGYARLPRDRTGSRRGSGTVHFEYSAVKVECVSAMSTWCDYSELFEILFIARFTLLFYHRYKILPRNPYYIHRIIRIRQSFASRFNYLDI